MITVAVVVIVAIVGLGIAARVWRERRRGRSEPTYAQWRTAMRNLLAEHEAQEDERRSRERERRHIRHLA
jgi:hypothetical protein